MQEGRAEPLHHRKTAPDVSYSNAAHYTGAKPKRASRWQSTAPIPQRDSGLGEFPTEFLPRISCPVDFEQSAEMPVAANPGNKFFIYFL
jgi:hypothetical protein